MRTEPRGSLIIRDVSSWALTFALEAVEVSHRRMFFAVELEYRTAAAYSYSKGSR